MIHSLLELVSNLYNQSLLHAILILSIIVAVTYIFINETIRASARYRGFKGPWQNYIPFVGVIPSIRENAAEKYRQWAKKYGDVYQIQLGNVPIVVVNSAAAAREIFGQNSQALSSRPVFYTFHKVLSNTAGTTIGTSPFSDSLKRRRKGAASALNKPSVTSYLPHLDIETLDFLREALMSGASGALPINPLPLVQRLSLSLALTLNWGTRITTSDPMFAEITHVEEEISRFRSTTGNLQDYIPLLRLNPFSAGSRRAREMRARRDVYLQRLNNDLDARISAGTHVPCIQANVILDKEARLNGEELTSISLTMLSGGLDTLTTLMQWSIALLGSRPDLQDAALAAIHALYPPSSSSLAYQSHGMAEAPLVLCPASDDHKCAYVAALVRECLRYYTVLRLALPRTSIRAVTYKGLSIPAGSTIFLNAWACNMDTAVWGPSAPIPTSEPGVFDPERWLVNPDAPLFTYGLGYRMCAGSLLANRELYLVFMRMIAAFEIKLRDGVVDVDPVGGSKDPTSLVTVPRDYEVVFWPRDEGALRRALAEVEKRER